MLSARRAAQQAAHWGVGVLELGTAILLVMVTQDILQKTGAAAEVDAQVASLVPIRRLT